MQRRIKRFSVDRAAQVRSLGGIIERETFKTWMEVIVMFKNTVLLFAFLVAVWLGCGALEAVAQALPAWVIISGVPAVVVVGLFMEVRE